MEKEELLFPELSYKIVGALFEVFNELGHGYQEKYYQKAVAKALQKCGIKFQEQTSVNLKFDNENIGKYFLDFLVENKIILELKKDDYFKRKNIEQVYAYLKALKLQLAIIANFTSKGVKFKRILNLY